MSRTVYTSKDLGLDPKKQFIRKKTDKNTLNGRFDFSHTTIATPEIPMKKPDFLNFVIGYMVSAKPDNIGVLIEELDGSISVLVKPDPAAITKDIRSLFSSPDIPVYRVFPRDTSSKEKLKKDLAAIMQGFDFWAIFIQTRKDAKASYWLLAEV